MTELRIECPNWPVSSVLKLLVVGLESHFGGRAKAALGVLNAVDSSQNSGSSTNTAARMSSTKVSVLPLMRPATLSPRRGAGRAGGAGRFGARGVSAWMLMTVSCSACRPAGSPAPREAEEDQQRYRHHHEQQHGQRGPVPDVVEDDRLLVHVKIEHGGVEPRATAGEDLEQRELMEGGHR